MAALRSKRFSVNLMPSVLAKLDAYAAQHRWSRSSAAEQLIEQGLGVVRREPFDWAAEARSTVDGYPPRDTSEEEK